MTSVRGLVLAAVVLATAVVVAACAQPKDQFANDSCEVKASKAAVDESCAIELSKPEVAARLGDTAYAKYNARFDPAERLWIVMAYNEDGPPDSHVYLSITLTGKVTDFRGAP
jgi:hypothetical protein